jgi:hypothetical protein
VRARCCAAPTLVVFCSLQYRYVDCVLTRARLGRCSIVRLSKGFKYVSFCPGGYQAAHVLIKDGAHTSDAQLLELIDHQPDRCGLRVVKSDRSP